jgi:hypothetical protein
VENDMAKTQPFTVEEVEKMYTSKRQQLGYEEGATKNEVRNQFPEDKKGAKYDNDSSGWVAGSKTGRSCYHEDGTGYPGGGFDHRDPKTGMPRKW